MDHDVCFFEIAARDVAAARAFYERLFGWKTSEAGGDDYLFVRTSSQGDAVLRGGLRQQADADQRAGTTVFVTVGSVDEAARQAETLGGKVISPKTALGRLGWVATITDPEGNAVGLFEPVPEGVANEA